MSKSISLLILVLGACAVETGPDTELDPSETAGPDTEASEDTDTELSQGLETRWDYEPCPYHDCPPPPEPGPRCEIRGLTVQLDQAPANVDDSDGKVTFCHATSSATNPFVIITTSVSACKAHVEHEHLEQGGHLDVFPTGGCED